MTTKKKKKKTWADIFNSQRRDWGSISPVTKIIPNKKKHRKEKHKNKEWE